MGMFGGALLEKLDYDRLSMKTYCDVVIKVQGISFHSHRCLLGTVSGYFNRLFHSNFKETESHEIEIKGPLNEEIHPRTLELVFSYIYTERINLTSHNIRDVLSTAEYFDIEQLKLVCVKYLINEINDDTWLFSLQLATAMDLSPVLFACTEHICKSEDLSNCHQMTSNEIKAVLKCVQDDKLKQIKGLEVLLMWTEWNLQDRLQYFSEFEPLIDCHSMPTKYLNEHVLTHSVVQLLPDLVQSLQKVLSSRALMVVGGRGCSSKSSAVTYCPRSQQSTRCASPVYPCFRSAVATDSQWVFVAGGWGNEAHLQRYDIQADEWTVENSELITPRTDAAGAVCNQKFYILGGWSDLTSLSSVEVYNITSAGCEFSTEHSGMSMLCPRWLHAVVVRQHEIVICGGNGNGAHLSSVEVLNTVTNKQYELPPMLDRRSYLAAVLFRDELVVIGGLGCQDQKLSSVERFSFATNTWTYLPPLTTPRFGHTACVYQDTILVIGGCGTDTVECFDPKESAWKIYDQLKVPRYLSASVQL